MKWRCALLVALAISAGSPIYAAETKTYGDWVVAIDSDRFDDTKHKVIALLPSTDGGHALAVRCLSGEISFALMGDRYREGDQFLVKFRADQKPIIDTTATALSDKMIEVNTSSDMVGQLNGAREYAFRVMGAASFDFIFRGGSGAAKALNEVSKACPADAK